MYDKDKQKSSKWSKQENDINKISLGANDAPRISKKANNPNSTTKVEKVEYSPMLKNFLTYLEDKEILELTGTVPNTYYSILNNLIHKKSYSFSFHEYEAP